MHIIGFIFTLILIVLVIGLFIIGSLVKTIFRFGNRKPTQSSQTKQYTYSANNLNEDDVEQSGNKQKVFSNDEGEYVDFEEVD